MTRTPETNLAAAARALANACRGRHRHAEAELAEQLVERLADADVVEQAPTDDPSGAGVFDQIRREEQARQQAQAGRRS